MIIPNVLRNTEHSLTLMNQQPKTLALNHGCLSPKAQHRVVIKENGSDGNCSILRSESLGECHATLCSFYGKLNEEIDSNPDFRSHSQKSITVGTPLLWEKVDFCCIIGNLVSYSRLQENEWLVAWHSPVKDVWHLDKMDPSSLCVLPISSLLYHHRISSQQCSFHNTCCVAEISSRANGCATHMCYECYLQSLCIAHILDSFWCNL